ncbi:MAG: DNA polymerase III subunit gamma/tau, partial [Hyphomicrobiales bacterium]|nr:DNA polymerase III subunit gamma/tau [Hyphomicrobiales bacterium]
ELIGQEALVRTLTNAIRSGRLAHAYLLTGVRGVGKTTTARILARALNCVGADGAGGPTAEPCGRCEPCVAIAADRHVDVLELDAASRTGVDDVREIIDGVRYKPVSARYRVYIIDEVHMLSRNAFNALLKTLEEPPEHTKFVFATTELRKIPVTVLSRCQRFDLRRVEPAELARHFTAVARQENAVLEPDAAQLLARAADGSVRDGLSLLDQAIVLATHGGEGGGAAEIAIDAELVRGMLGLADRDAICDLFEAVMQGGVAKALALYADLHRDGADPLTVLQDLLELCHAATRHKLGVEPELGAGAEAARLAGVAAPLAVPALTRAWQILLKGVEDLKDSPRPLASAEMALIRLAYASELPTPEEALRKLAETTEGGPRHAPPLSPVGGGPRAALSVATANPAATDRPAAPARAAEPRAAIRLARFEDVVALARAKRDIQLVQALEQDARVERFEQGSIAFSLVEGASPSLAQTLARRLQEWTGERWMVALTPGSTAPTLRETANAREAERTSGAQAHPLVRKVLERFKGARVIDVRTPESAASAPPPPTQADDDVGYIDLEPLGDDDL